MRSLLIVFLLLGGCVRTLPDTRAPAPQTAATARSVEQAVQRLSVQPLWPGFDPRTIPLAIHDGRQTWLFRHPSPPAGFVAAPDGAQSLVMPGRLGAITANTSADINGVATATLLLDASAARSGDDWAATAVHEAFHVFQRARHPAWSGNEADLFVYPVEFETLLPLRRLETRALARALAAGDRDTAACWARQAVALRTSRLAGMDPAFAAYERGTELNEGLASYVQLRASGRSTLELPAQEYLPEEVRQRAYATGTALALLLDRFAPDWPASFEENDKQTLDGALGTALGTGGTCAFDAAETAREEDVARADLAAMRTRRERHALDFGALPGWRVVVEAPDAQPLWPQGFDPLNVERLAPTRVLHTRFARLGNDRGQLETLGVRALSEGVGPHPLFQGVRRVEVAGLATPSIADDNGAVVVKAEGFALRFRDARVDTNGQTITVRLPAP